MAAIDIPAEQRFVFEAEWDTYVAFSNKLGKWNVRCNYDGVNLELMTVSSEHEQARNLLASLLSLLTQGMNIGIHDAGSMICRRQDLGQGFEPDVCYWIAHKAQVSSRKKIDLARDPPPDLVLEIDISASYLDRMAIAARLGILEVWCWDGERLRFMLLRPNGKYTKTQRSRALPFLSVSELHPFLHPDVTQSKMTWMQTVLEWIHKKKVRSWRGATS